MLFKYEAEGGKGEEEEEEEEEHFFSSYVEEANVKLHEKGFAKLV
jgi:hypothetical protein